MSVARLAELAETARLRSGVRTVPLHRGGVIHRAHLGSFIGNGDTPDAAAAEAVALWEAAQAPPPVERIEVELVGGPHHGLRLPVRIDRRRIEVPMLPPPPDDAPEAVAAADFDATARSTTEIVGFTAIYLRADEAATTAAYHDLEMDT